MLLFAILVSPLACDVSLEAQLNAEREKYDFLIPTLPSLDSALPTLGPASDIGSESTLITNWRTQTFYWTYALESLAAALNVREADTPLLVDLAAQRIVWGPTEMAGWMSGVSYHRSRIIIPIGRLRDRRAF